MGSVFSCDTEARLFEFQPLSQRSFLETEVEANCSTKTLLGTWSRDM